MTKPIVSIIGRPNVGKSCLFNRILGRRAAVVDDIAGVTRDRLYAEATWSGVPFTIVDTGGVVPPSKDQLTEDIRTQVELVLAESSAVVFLVDILTGPTDIDLFIAKLLQRGAHSKVILTANKAESPSTLYDLGGFMSLGLGEPLAVSALHGQGVGELLDRVLETVGAHETAGPDVSDDVLKIAILGRPNAGKSSLVNRLLGTSRMIVHDQPGTTRDAVDSLLRYHGREALLIDTAGLRKRSRVKERVEHYANLRALDSIPRSDICVLVVDAALGVQEQDVRIMRQIEEAKRGLVLCLNKWDLVAKDAKTYDTIAKELRRRYMQLRYVPMLTISALTGQRAPAVLETAFAVRERMHKRVPTGAFRRALTEWVTHNPHPVVGSRPVKIMGGKQAPADHPLFLIFTANHRLVKPSYERYLTNNIQEAFDFSGCPITLVFKPPSPAGARGGAAEPAATGERR
ncbi:MAG: ribosome biogenesis GTPase Der [Chitinivibrionales bacterium]|nr:ribosome biogenesis GTPase Der [Chitinivibrionales bacterium]